MCTNIEQSQAHTLNSHWIFRELSLIKKTLLNSVDDGPELFKQIQLKMYKYRTAPGLKSVLGKYTNPQWIIPL